MNFFFLKKNQPFKNGISAVSTECAISCVPEAELLGLKVPAAHASAKAHLSKDTDDIATKRKDHYFLAIA